MRHVVCWFGFWVLGFVLWLLYTGTIARLELLFGAVAAGIGALGAEAVRAQGVLRFSLRGPELLRLWRVPRDLLREYVVVLLTVFRAGLLGRRAPGRFRAYPYDAGAKTTPFGAGWRALATVAGNVSPNTIIIDVDPERNEVVMHELDPDHPTPEPL